MASRSLLVDRLGAVTLFSRCTKRDLRVIARHLEMVSVPAGTVVVREGDAGDRFFVVISGEASVHRGGRKVGSLEAGDHFGELALLDPAPRSGEVRAMTDLELGTLGHRMFMVLVRDLPGVTSALLASLAGQVRVAQGKSSI